MIHPVDDTAGKRGAPNTNRRAAVGSGHFAAEIRSTLAVFLSTQSTHQPPTSIEEFPSITAIEQDGESLYSDTPGTEY